MGKGGLLQPVGDAFSKEGINRAERGGKDDSGSSGGAVGDSVASGAKGASDTVTGGAKSAGDAAQGAGGYVSGGLKSAGGYVGSLWGGKKEGEGEAEKK